MPMKGRALYTRESLEALSQLRVSRISTIIRGLPDDRRDT